jgi:hypothetical protein
MPVNDDQLPDDEITRRMERGLRKALNTPPQPHGKNPRSPRQRSRRSRNSLRIDAIELPLKPLSSYE